MAAFGFFRRRQKMVLWIMVLLMVAFLIPTATQSLFQPNLTKEVVGMAGETKITVGDRNNAGMSLQLFNSLRLAQYILPLQAFYMVGGPEADANTHWALLVQEAKAVGMTPNQAQLDQFLVNYDLGAGHLRLAVVGSNITERQARKELADLLAVRQAYETNAVGTWPSLAQLQHTFVFIRQKIQVAMVDVPAQKYVGQIPDPGQDDIKAWFERYRNFLPDDPTNRTEFGFGYSLPNRAQVQYVYINTKAVEEAVMPTQEQVREYWQRYQGQIMIKVPASAPATAPADGSKAPEFVDVPADKLSHAEDVIRETLKAQMGEAKINELIARIRELSERFSKEPNPYAKVVEAMVLPADSLLNTKVEGLEPRTKTLSELIDLLSKNTKVQIVYPFGKHGDITLDGQLKVQADPKWNGQTLGAVLSEIASAHKFPAMRWVTCEGMGNSIFPSEPVNMVPIRAGDSGLATPAKIAKDPLLSAASISKEAAVRRGEGLSDILASTFRPEGEKAPAIREGEEFRQAMYISGADEGRLLWRLAGLARSASPTALTDALTEQVVRDWKIQQAFNKAYEAAKEIANQVEQGANLEAIAKTQGLTYDKTGMISRQEAQTMDPTLVDKAFDLSPANPDHPDPRPAVTVAPLYRQQKAAVLQRLAFDPAVKSELTSEILTILGEKIIGQRTESALLNWFSGAEIERRMNYVPKRR